VKTTPQSPSHLKKRIRQLRQTVNQSREQTPPDVVNLDYWYSRKAIRQLTRITASVHTFNASQFRDLCQVAISVCARKASLADPRVSVPVKLRADRYGNTEPLHFTVKQIINKNREVNVVDMFFSVLENYASQIESLWAIRNQIGRVTELYENTLGAGAKSLTTHPDASVDLIITSPPYLGAQKYVRATSLALGWLSLAPSDGLRRLEALTIGREHFHKSDYGYLSSCGIPEVDDLLTRVFRLNPLRAHIATTYITEMREALSTCYRILKPSGKLVLVSGSNSLCGRVFDTTAYLKHICEQLGFSVLVEMTDVIKSRGLMTHRNKTAGLIPMESVILFRK
jgi:hypothetical protein